jgi:CheY-like chemotaxis protein
VLHAFREALGERFRLPRAILAGPSRVTNDQDGWVGPARVLVADDESSIRLLVSRVLKRANYEVAEAADGHEAIALLDQGEFDAVVLDLMMPRVDGFGVVEHLISTRPTMLAKTVILTAFPKTAARERLHHLCHVLSKPFELDEFLKVVQQCALAPGGAAQEPMPPSVHEN